MSLCNPMDCSTSGFPVLHYLLEFVKLMSTDSMMPSSRLIPSPLFSSCSQTCPAAGSFPVTWLFKILELQQQHQSFQWIFRVDSLQDWLAWSPWRPRDSQESLQHHSSKASILQHSAFFIVQFAHPYMTTGKTIAFTIWTFPITYKKAF